MGQILFASKVLSQYACLAPFNFAAAMKYFSAWLDLNWYRPGSNTPARKQTFVRKVKSGGDTHIVGSTDLEKLAEILQRLNLIGEGLRVLKEIVRLGCDLYSASVDCRKSLQQ